MFLLANIKNKVIFKVNREEKKDPAEFTCSETTELTSWLMTLENRPESSRTWQKFIYKNK